VAFAAVTLALMAQWLPHHPGRQSRWLIGWLAPLTVSLVAASMAGIVSSAGLTALATLALACGVAARHPGGGVRVAAHAVMLAVAAGLFLHVMPGFDNPRVIHEVVLTAGAQPYTKYLNFDKAVAALLLCMYARSLATRGPSAGDLSEAGSVRLVARFAWRFGIMVAAVMALSLVLGYVRWEPKQPAWWPMWLWSMVFFTALPEEVLFRGLLQTWITNSLGGTTRAAWLGAIVAGGAFGLAHVAGGPLYVGLATAAGIGYGWICLATRSIGAAIAAHAGLNAVHFFLFTYPALRPM
jgi:membrane protease YdiL (CAAX protease family)